MPKGKTQREEGWIIQLELEKSRISREKSMALLNKSVILYFTFIIVAVLGVINDYITVNLLTYIVLMGLIALVMGTIPYLTTVVKEQKNIENILEKIKNGKEK
ncbi:MAG: hypothetical protein ACQEP1_00850 [Nanobdellota archaeon]